LISINVSPGWQLCRHHRAGPGRDEEV